MIGSLNMDLVTYVPHLPQPGETIASTKFSRNAGGKGANQAVAAAKLGADVWMIGRVGSDEFGEQLLEGLQQAHVHTDGIIQGDVTGMAFINVSASGENNIVLVPGANAQFKRSDIDQMKNYIVHCDLIIMQLEIPLYIVEYVLQIASSLQKEVILNPAPAHKLSSELIKKVHTLILNETELEMLTGISISTEQQMIEAAQTIKALGVQRVIITLGAKGSLLLNNDQQVKIPAYQVNTVDTTAAGDSYLGAFAVGITTGMTDQEAAQFASKVAAIVVTREGAQQSLPTYEEVERTQFSHTT